MWTKKRLVDIYWKDMFIKFIQPIKFNEIEVKWSSCITLSI